MDAAETVIFAGAALPRSKSKLKQRARLLLLGLPPYLCAVSSPLSSFTVGQMSKGSKLNSILMYFFQRAR